MKLLPFLLFLGCAHTTLYNSQGRRIAHFEGDMHGLHYSQSRDGSTVLDAAEINHSIPTKAQGDAAAGKLRALEGIILGVGAGKGLLP